MVSTRNIDYSATYTKGATTSHSANIAFLISIPISIQDVNLVELIDMALIKEGYDFMTNVTVSNTSVIAIIYNSITIKVEGTGWKSSNASSQSENGISESSFKVIETKDGIALEKVSTKDLM